MNNLPAHFFILAALIAAALLIVIIIIGLLSRRLTQIGRASCRERV